MPLALPARTGALSKTESHHRTTAAAPPLGQGDKSWTDRQLGKRAARNRYIRHAEPQSPTRIARPVNSVAIESASEPRQQAAGKELFRLRTRTKSDASSHWPAWQGDSRLSERGRRRILREMLSAARFFPLHHV